MTLVKFIAEFKKALKKYHRFDSIDGDNPLLRTWVPAVEGGYCGLDPICFLYWVKTGKVSADWFAVAINKLGLKDETAWRIRYASDNRVPKRLDRHAKIQALRIRRRLISIVRKMKKFYRRYTGSPLPYKDMRTKKSAEFAQSLAKG